MTDDSVIKEAAKAINRVRWNHALPHASQGGVNWTDADLARAALAVFEETGGRYKAALEEAEDHVTRHYLDLRIGQEVLDILSKAKQEQEKPND